MTVDDAFEELSGRFKSLFGVGLKKYCERTTDCNIEYKGGVTYEE